MLNCPTLVGNVKEGVSEWKMKGDLREVFLENE